MDVEPWQKFGSKWTDLRTRKRVTKRVTKKGDILTYIFVMFFENSTTITLHLLKGNKAHASAPLSPSKRQRFSALEPERKDDSMNKQYIGFLNSVEWKLIRNARKEMDGQKCTRCGSAEDLEVHHKTYDMHPQKGLLDLSNLITLCHNCHSSTHGKSYGMRELDEFSFCKTCAWMNDHAGPILCLRTMSPYYGEYMDPKMVCDWYWPWCDVDQNVKKCHLTDEEAMKFLAAHHQGEEEFE